jgi:hypothetical protein
MTLAGVAAGAALLGGVAMIAGTLKGGAEGAKWTSDGGMLATVGTLGMGALGAGTAAETATNASVDAADSGAISAGTQATINSNAAAGTATNMSTAATNADQLAFNATQDGLFNGGAGTPTYSPSSPPSLGSTNLLNASNQPAVNSNTPAANEAAARGAATNSIPTTAQPGAGYNWDAAAGKWQPPSSSLTSNNNMMTLLGNSMSGYSQGQNTQAQIDAMKALQTQRIQADQARVANSQYNPLLTASNK